MKILIVVFLILLAACASVKYYSSKGEELYYNKCGNCHRTYNKEEFTPEKWKSIMQKMAPKARLTADEHDIILEYLTTGKP